MAHTFTWNIGDNKDVVLDDCVFALRMTRGSANSSKRHKISLHLKSMPQTIGALKLNYSIRCRELLFAHRHDDVFLGISYNIRTDSWRQGTLPNMKEMIKRCVSDDIHFAADASFDFDVEITIVTKFDPFGGIFCSTNKPIHMRATQQSEKVVFGFVHEILEFERAVIQRAPLSLLELIHRFFTMLLNTQKSTRIELEWRFDDPSAVSMFLGSRKGDVLTSKQFEICECVFYLELTPNGWGTCVREGDFTVWVALAELPTQVCALSEVQLTVCCDEIEYKDVKTEKMENYKNVQKNAPYSFGGRRAGRFAKFKDLERFTLLH